MCINKRLEIRRKELNLTLEQVGNLVGVSKSTVLKWETGFIENMKRDKIQLLANALRVSPLWIMGLEEEDSKHIIEKGLPILGTIAAGTPILAEQNITDHFQIDSSIKADFVLKVKGDSMINIGVHTGDLAFIHKQDMVEDGEIAAVLIDEEATLKRFYRQNGTITLIAENSNIPPRNYTSGDIRILGKLVAVLNVI